MGNKSGNGDKACTHASRKHDSTSGMAGAEGHCAEGPGVKRHSAASVPADVPGQQQETAEQKAAGNDIALLGAPLAAVSTTRCLEPRVLLDAAGLETAQSVMDAVALQQAEAYFDNSKATETSTAATIPLVNPQDFLPPLDTNVWYGNNEEGEFVSISAPASDSSLQPEEFATPEPVGQSTSGTIVFIDGSVENIDELVSTIDPSFEVIVLSTDRDGVEQIAETLQDKSGIDAIHIISHGRSGTLELGNAKLTAASMIGKHADEMATIQAALSEGADLLIYGCDFGVGARGASAVEALVRATSADVAASDDLTGAAALGGDWDLEIESGLIEAQAIEALGWTGTLAVDGQLIAGEAFAAGNFVEMGINANGTFGANDANRPAGYHDPRTGLFGFIANPQQDGWVNYDGDFFTPGTPHEGFILEINGVNYVNDTSQAPGIPGSITSVTTGVLCGQNSVEVVWTGNIGGIEITRTYTILENELFILSETTLRNTTGGPLNNIYFAAQLDPDNDQPIHGDFATTNIIDSQPGGGANVAQVTASQAPGANGSTEPDGSSISLVADDPRAMAGYGGFLTGDASSLYDGTATGLVQTIGSSTFHDESISIAFDIGTLAAGESTTINYTYLLEGDPAAAIACLNLPDAQPDGPVSITGGIAMNIDVLANDSDPNGDPITITHIVDPSDPGTQIAISVGSPVTLGSGTVVELLADGTLDVTTTPLGLGAETFDYVIDDGVTGTAQATVTLDRSQGDLISVTSPLTGAEDNNIPLNITVDPALTSGGSQLDIIGTETGFRDASAGAAPTTFSIPPGTTSIRITSLGGNDNGSNSGEHEDFQTSFITVDLVDGTYSGQIFHSLGQGSNESDNYAFSNVALGFGSTSDPNLVGDNSNGHNDVTVSVTGSSLSIVETQGTVDQAYLIEYLTADGSSANFLGTAGDVQIVGDTDSTFTPPAGSNFAVLTIQDGRGGLGSQHEDKGIGRIIVDLDTGLASGTIFSVIGRGGTNTAAFSFTGYDITSGLPILDPGSGATISGDATASAIALPDLSISLSGGDVIVERTAAAAAEFTTLVSAEFYDRLNVGSGAVPLGDSAVEGDYFNHQSNVNTFDLAIAGSAETGVITLAMNNLSSGSGTNENGGTAQIFVDLVNGTTSGSFLTMRNSTPDLVSWTDVPFGIRLFDHAGTVANHAAIADFSDQLSAVMQFDVITNPDGSQTLRVTAQTESNDASSFQNYNIVMQASWSGRLPVEISGAPAGGSFSAGTFNPVTGNWEIDPADVATLEFIPPEHFSGNTVALIASYNGNAQTIDINVTRVADAPAIATVDQSGDEDTVIDISSAVSAALVDADGSESITLIELNSIPVGHTVSDGTNTFTATAGTQAVDVTTWNLATLTYQGAPNAHGTFNIGVRAQTIDNDGFSATTDTAETTDTFNIVINSVNDIPVLNLDPDNDSGTPGDTSDDGADDGGFEVTFNENDPAVQIVDSDVTLSDPDDDVVEIVVTLTNGFVGDTINFPNTMPGNVTAAVSPASTLGANGTLTLTLTGDATTTVANWQAILQSLTFEPNTNDIHNPDPTQRVITIEASDSQMASSGALTTLVNVVPVNDLPTLDLDDDNSSGINAGNYQGTYVENAVGAAISSGVAITDLDDSNLEGMTVTLTNGEIGDILNIAALPPGISLVGVPPTELTAAGTITVQLTGSASLSDYQDAIAAITFANGSDDPTAGIRNITVVGTDGDADTPARTAFITVQPVNDAPEVVDPLNPGTPPADPNSVIPAQSGDDGSAITPLDGAQYFADPDDTILAYSLHASAPAWLSINPATGEVTGTPPSDASQNSNTGTPGEYDVIIIAEDPGGLTAQTTATFTISNPAPVAQDDAFTTNENDPAISGNVLADNGSGADADPDGDTPLTITEVGGNAADVGIATAGTSGGLFTITATGGFTFVDNGDFEDLAGGETRNTTITYQVSDGEGGFDTATVTVTVTGTNDGPTVVTGNEIPDATGDDAETITPIETATAFADADTNDTLTYSAVGLPAGLSINPTTGQISGTIDGSASQNGNTGPAANGVYTITVTADDGNGGTASDSFTLTISNVGPDAVDDALTGDENTVSSGNNVLADNGSGADSDADGDSPLTISQVAGNAGNVGVATAGSSGGLFTIDANGDLTFDPDGDFDYLAAGETATTTITYELGDGEGGVDTATVTYTVTGVNDAPVAVDPLNPTIPPADPNDYIPLQSGADNTAVTPLDVTQYVSDPDLSDTLTFTIAPAELPPGLTFDGATISGTLDPAASQGGDDPVGAPGTYLIPLTVTDGNGGTFTTTITYDISNPPPVAADDDVSGNEDSVTTGNLLADNTNGADTDPDGDTITVTRVAAGNAHAVLAGLADGTGIGPATVAGSTGGTFTVNSDGSFSFDPGTDFQDLDNGETRVTEIVYQIDDGDGGTDTAVVSFTVTGSNDAPVVIDPNDPFPNPNDPPVPADPDNVIPDVSGNDGQALTPVDISPYFVDVDGEALTFGFDPLDPDVPAWLSIDSVTGIITGTPPSDASQGGPNSDGIYPITLTATDPDGEIVTTTLDFTIDNLAPVAQDDAVSAPEDGVTSGNVFADNGSGIDADTAPDSDPIEVSQVNGVAGDVGVSVAGSAGGTFIINDDGTFDFDPGTDFQDLDNGESRTTTVSYTIDDGNGGTDTATVTVTVNGSNDAPVIIDPNVPMPNPNDPPVPADPNNIIPDVTSNDAEPLIPVDVSPYFHDVEGDPVTLSLDPATTPPWLTIDSNGIISGTPPSDASQGGPNSDGVYQITIIGTDDDGAQVTTTMDFTILNVPPTTTGLPEQDDVAGEGFEADITGGFNDPDGDTLTYTATGLPGGLTLDPNTGLISGTISGSAVGDAPNGDGIYTVEVTADDGQGGTVSTIFTFTVTDPVAPENPVPEGPPLSPAEKPGTGDGPANPDMVVDKAVNGTSTLGGDTGLFNFDHPLTAALYQISPLSEGIALDAFGHPITETFDWIEKTRKALNDEIGSGNPDGMDGYFSGGDAKVAAGGADYVVRSLAWNGVIYLEIIASDNDMAWEVDSINGASASGISQVLGGNLVAISSSPGPLGNSVVLIGSDRNGDEVVIRLRLELSEGQFELVDVTANRQSAGFSGQLYAISNTPLQEARALLQKSS